MIVIKILVACEESQRVTLELRRLGHEAYSCDIEPCSGGHPEWHLQQDVLPLLQKKWDMIIAFPPCTYLSNAGACHLWRGGVLNEERYRKGLEAKEFFLSILHADCPRIAVENPISSKIYEMPAHTQTIHPWQFGHPVQKKTRLWLKGLPLLEPTQIVTPTQSCHDAHTWFSKGEKTGRKTEQKHFPALLGLWQNNGHAAPLRSQRSLSRRHKSFSTFGCSSIPKARLDRIGQTATRRDV